ncbi:MAG TPA: carboxylesterase family protein [Terriglobia bacterium]|nr:carboxylesterase family protein [Terriglobia bacterium]
MRKGTVGTEDSSFNVSSARKIKGSLCAVLLVVLFCAPAIGLAQTRAIRTESGMVTGVALSHGLEVFKGIPFAAPPLGRLRWRPPQPPAAWKGVLKADHFGAPCMQSRSPERLGPWTRVFLSKMRPSEDCLYLNIWSTAKRPEKLRPVMVWIYGGGFTSGAGSVEIYDGASLAQKGVVVVNANYRVGPLGFFACPELTRRSPHHSSGNYGLLDQIAALRWVQRNIAAFGGDPHQVTIFGQSAGGESVWLLMQSPLAAGLFERAIVMSGAGVLPIRPLTGKRSLASAEQEGQEVASRLGAHSLEQLRALPAEKITRDSGHARWAPIEDGWVIRPGWHPGHEVSVINGMVAEDIGIGYYGTGPAPPMTLEDYHKTMRGICGAAYSECEELYPATGNGQASAAMHTALQDRARVSLYKWAASQRSRSPQVYTYYFNQKLPWPQHPEYGVFHSSEVPYVFNNLRLMDRPWRPADYGVAREISSYWTNFGKTGNPNSKGLPEWPTFKVGDKTIMQLAAHMAPIPLATPAREHFWMEHLKKPLGF